MSILYISCRQSFANFITGEDFKEIGLVNYLDFKENKQEITKHKKICCSLESLHEIEYIDKFDIIILDEVETVLNILSSETMQQKTLYNYNLLKSFIVYLGLICNGNSDIDFVFSGNNLAFGSV